MFDFAFSEEKMIVRVSFVICFVIIKPFSDLVRLQIEIIAMMTSVTDTGIFK